MFPDISVEQLFFLVLILFLNLELKNIEKSFLFTIINKKSKIKFNINFRY